MPLFVAIPAVLPIVKAAVVGVGTIALGAMALFFGKRRGASEPPKSPQSKNAQAPPAPTLITRVRDQIEQACTRASEVVRETVEVTVENITEHAEELKNSIARNITKAAIARVIGLALQQSPLAQSVDVEGLLKAFLKSPPRTRAPSFAV